MERENASGGGAERESMASRFRAISAEPNRGLEPINAKIMTQVEIESRKLKGLSQPGAPRPMALK